MTRPSSREIFWENVVVGLFFKTVEIALSFWVSLGDWLLTQQVSFLIKINDYLTALIVFNALKNNCYFSNRWVLVLMGT